MGNIRFIPEIDRDALNVFSVLSEQQNWGLTYVGAPEAWLHSKGEGVTVAIIDTGWHPHKDLVANFIEGHDATGLNDFYDHKNGHSTHVTGIIAANCGDQIGVMGIAPEAKIITIRCLDDDGSGNYEYIIEALKIARDLNVDVINMSLGTPIEPDNDALHNIIKEITDQGKIVVTAAGNDGGNVNFPARYDECIAVAAVEADGSLAKFSSRGPALDVAAPGVQIYSTWIDDNYIKLDGTSMACPCISGICALIIAWYKKHPSPDFVINQVYLTKLLMKLGGTDGQNIVATSGLNIGVPKFCNFNAWGENA